MKYAKRRIKKLLFAILILVAEGCATVPVEVVELSYATGKDLQSLYTSYDVMTHQLYENMRSQRLAYLDDVWYPKFLEEWRDDGELIAIAKGDKVWSISKEKLISTPPGTGDTEKLQTLSDWITFALYAYENKEEELLNPLDRDEVTLRADIKQAFDRIIRANATITAHLNSLREVQKVQDEALEALDLKELRDQINDGLINVSKNAEDALKKIKEEDSKIESTVSIIRQP